MPAAAPACAGEISGTCVGVGVRVGVVVFGLVGEIGRVGVRVCIAEVSAVAVRPAATAGFAEASHVLVSRCWSAGLGCGAGRADASFLCSGDGFLSSGPAVEAGSCTVEVESRWTAHAEGRGAVVGGASYGAVACGAVIWWGCWWEDIAVKRWFGLLTGTTAQAFVDEVRGRPRDAFAVFERALVDDHRPPLVVCALRSI